MPEDKRIIRLSLLLFGPILLVVYVVAFLVFRHCHASVMMVAKSKEDMGVLTDATVVHHRGLWKKVGYASSIRSGSQSTRSLAGRTCS